MAIVLQRDSDANDSNKSFTIPSGRSWKLQWVGVDLTSTATVGNRQLTLVITDGTNTLLSLDAGAVQAASNTYHYAFFSNAPNDSSFDSNDWLRTTIPGDMVLLPGFVIQVYDSAAVDAAADDMTVNLIYNERVAE